MGTRAISYSCPSTEKMFDYIYELGLPWLFVGGLLFGILVYINAYVWLWPMDRVRTLDQIGFAHVEHANNGRRKAAVVRRMQRARQPGSMPPVYPNGWFVVAESRQVSFTYSDRNGMGILNISQKNVVFLLVGLWCLYTCKFAPGVH